MLPVGDPTGRVTVRSPCSTRWRSSRSASSRRLAGLTGWVFAAGSLALGSALVAFALQLAAARGPEARRVFLARLVYLPLLLGLLVADRVPSQATRLAVAALALR